MKSFVFLLSLLLSIAMDLHPAFAIDVNPFKSKNLSPFIQVYGFPIISDSNVLSPGASEVSFSLDITNNFSFDTRGNEDILLDGETYRYELVFQRGVSESVEVGIIVPFIRHSGGTLDGFIESWHDFFDFPQGGRLGAPKDRLKYTYTENGITRLDINRSAEGLGDISIVGGYQLFEGKSAASRSSAVRFSLKLPTGDTERLLGSGSMDLAVSVTGKDATTLNSLNLSYYGNIGILYMSNGDILEEKQRHTVGFGSIGIGWKPFKKILFKVQFDAHTPFYKESSLVQLSSAALQVVLGGTLELFNQYYLDIGVIEDIIQDTVPDVSFHFNLRKSF